MRARKIPFFLSLAALLTLWGAPEAWAIRPLYANLALVAGGEGRWGFKDGNFATALFYQPMGMSISDDGTRLFVADSINNRIRVVHLDQDNEVTTLAGMEQSGKLDGPLNVAQFTHPRGVLYLPGERLVVNDFENQLLRLIDLKAGSVSTLAGGPEQLVEGPAMKVSMKGVRDMTYMAAADSIFFTQPDQGTLKRLDLKTKVVSTVLDKLVAIPNPAAIACLNNNLYVADKDLLQVFELVWKDNKFTAPTQVASTAGKVASLCLNGGILYALLANPGVPMQRFFLHNQFPQNDAKDGQNKQFDGQVVSYRNPWGDTVPPERLFPPRDASLIPYCGFVPDPSDIRKFYFTEPEYGMIVSYRDLFGFQWNPSAGERNSNGIDEVEYPAKKPKNTYRIIVVGDSRSAEVQNFPFQSDYHWAKRPGDNPYFPHNLSMEPQIERELNFLAALDENPMNYEVFNFSKHGDFTSYPTFAVPDVVKRNDVDLVIIFLTPHFPPEEYFDHPLSADGIPQYPNDMEFLAKPPLERLPPSGSTPRKFYDFCKAHGLVTVRKQGLDFDVRVFDHPELHDWLLEMYGKPLSLLNQKLSAMRTSGGQPVRLMLCNTYTGRAWDKNWDLPFWREVAKKYNFPIWDLNDRMNVLSVSYFPLTGDLSHLNPDGALFFGKLFAHELIREKLIPWDKSPQTSPKPSPSLGK